MPKREFQLAAHAGGFYDEKTGLSLLPGKKVVLDTETVGPMTATAIAAGGLLEVVKPQKGKGGEAEGDSEESEKK